MGSDEPLRYFRVHTVQSGFAHLAETDEDGEIIGLPVSLPVGSVLRPETGPSWVVLRRIGVGVAFNRPGAKEGMKFTYRELRPVGG